jgi:hypothetical protein
MKQLNEPEFTGKESVQLLQEYTKEFPYFQTAQSLLTRAMYEQQHVRFEKQLKLASVYSGDRKMLYNTIHPRPANLFSEKVFSHSASLEKENSIEKENTENVFAEEKNLLPPLEPVISENTENQFTPTLPVYTEDVEIAASEADIDDGPMVADPHEIIRKRLNEILGLEENNIEFKPRKTVNREEVKTENIIPEKEIPEREEKEVEDNTSFNVTENPSSAIPSSPISLEETGREPKSVELKKDHLTKIIEESILAKDVIDKGELEYALEATLIQSLEKLPVIEKEVVREKIISEKKRDLTFYDWLKQSRVSDYGKYEEVHAYESDIIPEEKNDHLTDEKSVENGKDVNKLIDRFIEADPKIVASKSEFYSPVSQAKKSITEDEDLVSETLAGIYKLQGNYLKARSCYQKLSLLYPEKMAYFAALISEIDKDLNNKQKEDL